MKIQDQAFGVISVKMQTINPDAGFNIKKIFSEGHIIGKLKILFKFLWFKNEFFLEKVGNNRKHNNSDDDIPNESWQSSGNLIR